MGHADGDAPEASPGAVIGQIRCKKASAGAGASLRVTIPVSLQIPESWKERVSLTVTAVVCSPDGYSAPVPEAPAPEAQYIDERGTLSVTAGLAMGGIPLDVGLNRPVGAEELVTDLTRTRKVGLVWTVSGRHRELPGTQEFSFEVSEADSRDCWVKVTAQLQALKKHFSRSPHVAEESAPAAEPLIDKDAPQADITLTLHAGDKLFYVGKPQTLPLAVGPDGFAVARGRGPATGSIVWEEDVRGRPGYTWVQTSPSPLVQVGDDLRNPRRRSSPVLIKPGSQLHAPGITSLTANYDVTQAPEWARRGTLNAVLDVDVVIDGTVALTCTTQDDCMTVGRTHRDISIDRPDISREHGDFNLAGRGWTYCHKSSRAPAQVLRGDRVIATVGQEDVTAVAPGDIVRLTPSVSLVLR
jgi:hypothetical protein